MSDERQSEREVPRLIEVAKIDPDTGEDQLIEFIPEHGTCPTCGESRPSFLIIDGKCDIERAAEQAAAITETIDYKPELTVAEVRQRRDRLLSRTDFTQMPDYSGPLKAEFVQIRQNLRDLTDTHTPEEAWEYLDQIEGML